MAIYDSDGNVYESQLHHELDIPDIPGKPVTKEASFDDRFPKDQVEWNKENMMPGFYGQPVPTGELSSEPSKNIEDRTNPITNFIKENLGPAQWEVQRQANKRFDEGIKEHSSLANSLGTYDQIRNALRYERELNKKAKEARTKKEKETLDRWNKWIDSNSTDEPPWSNTPTQ